MADSTGEPWYGVRTVYRWPGNSDDSAQTYEERVVLFRSESEEEAMEAAEREAREYAEQNEVEYIGLLQCYRIFAAKIGTGSEVFSLLRESSLTPDAYLSKHFDTGSERQRKG